MSSSLMYCPGCAQVISKEEARCPFCKSEIQVRVAEPAPTSSGPAAANTPRCHWCQAPMSAWTGKCETCGKHQPIARQERPKQPARAAAPAGVQAGGHAPLDDTFAWALTAVPPLGFLVSVGAPSLTPLAIPVALLIVNVLLVRADEKRLHAAGYRSVGVLLGTILVPIYLFFRARMVGRGWGQFLLWIGVAVASYAAVVTLGPVTMDTDKVASIIEDDWQSRTGQTVDVTCPATATVRVHESFTCDVSGDGLSSVNVEVTSHDGRFSWNAQ